jgi:hypothetical protein
LLDQLIALVTATKVVHRLEVVEVDEHHMERATATCTTSDRLFKMFRKECAVGEGCERVVECLMA